MKKLLVSALVIGFLLSFGAFGVIAVDQDINATIDDNLTISISPATVEFGAVSAGSSGNPASSGNISFDPAGSNVNVNVDVTNVTGKPFEGGLKFDGSLAQGQDYDILCVGNPCTYTPKTVSPTLDVPIGSRAGIKTGTITYIITGTPPA